MRQPTPMTHSPRSARHTPTGKIVALRGALLGSIVVFCLPAAVFLHSERGNQAGRGTRLLHYGVLGYGALMSLVGTLSVLLAG